jgi:hypothetical protein
MDGRYETYDTRLYRSNRVKRRQRDLFQSAFCALASAVIGAVAGPPGVVVGAILGGLVGWLAATVNDREDARVARHDAKLDAEIGVTRGTMGTRWVRHVPPRVGAFSLSSSGGSTGHGSTPAEGPMPEDGATWY